MGAIGSSVATAGRASGEFLKNNPSSLLLAIAAIMTGASGLSQSRAQKSEGAYQAQAFENNARIAEAQAADAIKRGDLNAAQHKIQVKRLIGSQRASLGAQGIEISSGSALDVQIDTASLGASDELTIKNNAWREAWGYRVQAADYRTSGEFARLSSQNKAKNTILTAGMNIANTALLGSYYAKGGKTAK